MDLDMGGTSQQWENVYLGPSVGWVRRPVRNVLSISAAGTYTIDLAISLVIVNVAGSVTLVLPSLNAPPSAGSNPGVVVRNPITIVDTGGNAQANPITIQAAVGNTILGLAQIQITANYGGYTLDPKTAPTLWSVISP